MEEEVTRWWELDLDADVAESPEVVEVAIIDADGSVLETAVVEYGSVDYTLPEVGFQKTTIDDLMAETTVANSDPAQLADYDAFVAADPTWETTRDEARNSEFSVLQTKYFSITTALDIVSNGMAIAVFWGMLKDAQARGRGEGLLVPGTDGLGGVESMTIVEGMVAALTLVLWRFGVDDLIPHGESGVSTILAARSDGAPFPNEGSLLPFSTVLARVAESPDPLPISEMLATNMGVFRAIEGSVADSSQYDTEDTYDPLLGNEATRAYRRTRTLQRLWDHKFVGTLQTAAFGTYDRYSDWLRTENPALAEWVKTQDAAGTHVDALLSLTVLLEDALDSDSVNLAVSLGINDVLVVYVERMIRFFKSYTTDLQRFSTYILISRPATETARLMNLLAELKVSWTAADALRLAELTNLLSKLRHAESDEIFTDLQFLLARLEKQDIGEFRDELAKLMMSQTATDALRPEGHADLRSRLSRAESDKLLADLEFFFTGIEKQDIAELFDKLSSRIRTQKATPAPPLRDAAQLKSCFARREVLTVKTRRQSDGSITTIDIHREDPITGMLEPILLPERSTNELLEGSVIRSSSRSEGLIEGYAGHPAQRLHRRTVNQGFTDSAILSLW